MKLDLDDPKLTAYALGELDETERAALAEQLKDSEEGRRRVEEIQQTAALVKEELEKEACPALAPGNREAVEELLEPARSKIIDLPWRGWLIASASAAAIIIFLLVASHTQVRYAKRTSSLNNLKQVRSQVQVVDGMEAARSASAPVRLYSGDNEERFANYSSAHRTWATPGEPEAAEQFQSGDTTYAYGGYGLSHELKPDIGLGAHKSGGGEDLSLTLTVSPEVAGRAVSGRAGREPLARKHKSAGELTYDFASVQITNGYFVELYGKDDIGDRIDDVNLGRPVPSPGTESYERVPDNPFLRVNEHPLSTFSIDVDTASYANVRRFLNQGQRPPRDAVRVEEMINYFPYNYAPPRGGDPFAVYLEVGPCPWNEGNRLARIGIKGKEIADWKRPSCNLVFLIDVSGSMEPSNKLPLVKRALRMLVEQMTGDDRIAIVTYATSAGVALESTSADHKRRIMQVIDSLEANGSTNGGEGIQRAYDIAIENFRRGGVNRIILCTDGDFNVGITDQGDLTRLIEQKARSGVFLSVLGFGMGNLKDSTMEKLADKGNGNYAYLDNLDEAHKVLVEQMMGTLVAIAKDVKVQIEFNPAYVRAYRLIGYENRIMAARDFHNDRKDAGEVGAGHAVTALYEIVPAPRGSARLAPDELKYQRVPPPVLPPYADELLTLKLRYKQPNADTSKLMEFPARDRDVRIGEASEDFRFTAAVAAFGMILRESQYRGNATLNDVLQLAECSQGYDPTGYRAEFVDLIHKAMRLR